MTSPQYQQRFFLAMNAGGEETEKAVKEVDPKLKDIQLVKEMFVFSEIVKFESAVALENKMKGSDPMHVDLAVEAMIMQLYMKDKFYLVF
jgi:hypothetical protein